MFLSREDALNKIEKYISDKGVSFLYDGQKQLLENVVKNKQINTEEEFNAISKMADSFEEQSEMYWSFKTMYFEYVVLRHHKYARDISRIPRVAEKFARLWFCFPDLRFTQLVGLICKMKDVEDDEFEKILTGYSDQYGKILEGYLDFNESKGISNDKV